MAEETDAIVVGAGLAGLVAAAELLDAGKRVVVVDQEPEASLGGQAWWSFGGLFLIDTPEQRRLGVRDSLELATQDWFASAGFDRDDDRWPRRWAEAYLDFAAGEKRGWLHAKGVRWFPIVGWAERGGQTALAHGNSVPRFHVTWGTGPAVVAPFIRVVRAGVDSGRARLLFRRRVEGLLVEDGTVVGVRGRVLTPSAVERGAASPTGEVGDFELRASAVILTTGGIGGDQDLVRRSWPDTMAAAPSSMLSGVPASVDGRGLALAAAAGARVINGDRMWHYTEGIANHSPVWARHGIRILPGPSSLWLDSTGRRLPAPLFPGFDTLATLEHLVRGGHEHSWFVLTQRIIEKEFALSGSEQNPDLTGKDLRLLAGRVRRGAAPPVQAFLDRGADFVSAPDLGTLLDRMEALGDGRFDRHQAELEVLARDREVENPFSKDAQITAIHGARRYAGDRLLRVAPVHRLLDPKAGPLHAVKLHVLTRKSLGGIETDLSARVLDADGQVVRGLWAAGEVSGFGGGGMHGYRSLEGTFLGGCLFSGRVAGRSVARTV